jgi:hypothetical protein
VVSDAKNPVKVRAGKIGAASRWGPRRIVRLDELDADTARLIRALVDAAEDEKRRQPGEAAAA